MLKLEILLQVQGELAAALVLELAPKNVADHLADVGLGSLCLDDGEDLVELPAEAADEVEPGERQERAEDVRGEVVRLRARAVEQPREPDPA